MSRKKEGQSRMESNGEAGHPEDSRRSFLRIAGVAFIVGGGLVGAARGGPSVATCGRPSSNGVGYNKDLLCEPTPAGGSDSDCGLISDRGWGKGAGGAGHQDNDCNLVLPDPNPDAVGDNDCGISHGNSGAHKDNFCPGQVGEDFDCGVKKDGFGGIHGDSDCTTSGSDNSNCGTFDFTPADRPERGDDPQCIHLDSN